MTVTKASHPRQPPAFFVIFFVEMWERFGYYGLQALLVLYMSKVFHFTDQEAYGTFAAFAALVYCTPMIGGYLSDKVIGSQRALALGTVLLVIGYSMLAIPTTTDGGHSLFYLALGTIIVGNGYFKPNPCSLLGRIYGSNNASMDSGFTLFYMSINIGSFFSMFISGYVAEKIGWNYAFALCALGLVFGLFTFLLRRKVLKGIGSEADGKPVSFKTTVQLGIATLGLIFLCSMLIKHLSIAHWALYATMFMGLLFYVYLFIEARNNPEERSKLLACLILTAFAVAFYCLYFQSPQSLNLFVDRNVDHHILGFYVATASFQSLNPFWILALAPLLSHYYTKRQRTKGDFGLPTKFAAGITLMGLGFLVLNASQHFANAEYQVSSWWVIASYFLQCLAELLVSALGLSMIAQLAPERFLTIMMGTWFIASAAAAYLSGILANLTSIPSGEISPAHSLHIYTHVFKQFGFASIAIGVVAFLLIPYLTGLINKKAVLLELPSPLLPIPGVDDPQQPHIHEKEI